MDIAFDGRAVANFVLEHCDEIGIPISNLSLQKIVFFCHVWHLIVFETPLVRHRFEAWEYGPVLQYLYHEFKNFGASAITKRSVSLNRRSGTISIVSADFSQEAEQLLRKVITLYARMSANDLVQLSHAPGGPWDRVWNHAGKVNAGMEIKDEDIVQFYSKVPPPYSIQ